MYFAAIAPTPGSSYMAAVHRAESPVPDTNHVAHLSAVSFGPQSDISMFSTDTFIIAANGLELSLHRSAEARCAMIRSDPVLRVMVCTSL